MADIVLLLVDLLNTLKIERHDGRIDDFSVIVLTWMVQFRGKMSDWARLILVHLRE